MLRNEQTPILYDAKMEWWKNLKKPFEYPAAWTITQSMLVYSGTLSEPLNPTGHTSVDGSVAFVIYS